MSSINLFNCLTLLAVVQGVLSQIVFDRQYNPKYPHDNYYLSQLKVKEQTMKNQIKQLDSDKEYLGTKLDLMNQHLYNNMNVSKHFEDQLKNKKLKIKELKEQIQQEYVNVDKMIAENSKSLNNIDTDNQEIPSIQGPQTIRAKRV